MFRKIFVVGLSIITIFAVSLTSAVEKEDIIVYYSFDQLNGTKFKDDSGNGYDTELVGKGELVEGQFGEAIHLNGGIVQHSPPSDFVVPIGENGEVTIEAWFNLKKHSGWDGIVSIEAIDAGCCEFRMMVNPDFNPFWDAGHHKDKSIGNFTFKLNQWYHYVLVANGKEGKIYVDGEFLGSEPENIVLRKFQKASIFIGAGEGPNTHPVEDAIIDEVVIYSKALTEEEVKTSMDLGVQGALAVEAKNKLATTWGQLKSTY